MEYEYPIYKVRAGEYPETPGTLTCRFINIDHGFRYHSGNPVYNDDTAGLRSPHTHSFWRDPETLEEWLLCLPHPYGEMAVKARADQPEDIFERYYRGDLSKIENPYNALFKAFDWSKSELGDKFWVQVRQNSLPEIPQKKETIMTISITTANKPGLYELAGSLLRGKGYEVPESTNNVRSPFLATTWNGRNYEVFSCGVNTWTEVSLEEFIKQINELPPAVTERKPKALGRLVRDYHITLTDKEIMVGCQKLSYATFKNIQAQILDFRKRSEKLEAGLDYDLHVTHAGIKVPELSSSYLIDFETFEKIEKEVAEYLK